MASKSIVVVSPKTCRSSWSRSAPENVAKCRHPRILQKRGSHAGGAGRSRIVTLDIPGKPWTTEQLAVQLEAWKLDGRDVALLVGGPEGLSPECKAAAEQSWSLSPLTLPHPLVRVLVAESLYRAWSITTNHPYHRE